MKHSLYGERDYAFGQLMLTLRTRMGLTQAFLAERLGVSRRAVNTWELGSYYPAIAHLKELIVLGVELGAFAAGHEPEEIRALWRAAHQKVLLDEVWLTSLLGRTRPALTLLHPEQQEAARAGEPLATQSAPAPLLDWGEALSVPTFYGREEELATLVGWVVEEGCRLVSVLGLGGIGKSALVVRAMRALAGHFEVVLFRSLRDAPSCDAWLESCLAVLAPEQQAPEHESLERCLSRLLAELRRRRVLLVLDNLEGLLSEGEALGRLRAGYEDYGQLLEQVAHTAHQSCLLLTSREHPVILRALEGRRALVRSLRLSGLEASACMQLLAEHELTGSPEEYTRLATLYGGNPLALSIVAETIADLFDGAISPFLSAGTILFGSITHLLEEQWARLSPPEQTVLSWLAILREPVSLEDLQAVLVTPVAPVELLEAVDGLRRRSLVERGQRAGSFTLQSVVLEFVTSRLVAMASEEIQQAEWKGLVSYALEQATAKDYVRLAQERLIVAPVLVRLQAVSRQTEALEQQFLRLLGELRSRDQQVQGYGPANLLMLLRGLRGHLRGLDLSGLAIRGAYLQGVEMQDARLSGACLRDTVLAEAFDAIWSVTISQSGQYWAAASGRGEVRVWHEGGQILHRVWQAHMDIVTTLAFSPDERMLASGSLDGSVKLWDVERGAPLWSGGQVSGIVCLAFSPDGSLLASGGNETNVRLWDAKRGTSLQELPHPGAVYSLAFSRDGHRLASGDFEGTIRFWQIRKSGSALGVQTLEAHSNWVRGLAFALVGHRLASASWDGTVKLWELEQQEGNLHLRQTLTGHTQQVQCLAWSPDGGTLASGSYDHTIRLWDGTTGSLQAVLQGHSAVVHSLAFTPDSRSLLSGSEDGTLRLWDVQRSEPLRVLQGYEDCLYDLDWSPDGTELASAGSDKVVSLWEVTERAGGRPRDELRGHVLSVYGVAWSPDGRLLASSGRDNAIRLWESATGTCIQVLRDLDHLNTLFWGVAWSPDGHFLASGTLQQGVLVWEVAAGSLLWVNRSHATWIRRVAWSPDGSRLVAGGDDGHVYVWDASDGKLLLRLSGHLGAVKCVAWSPDGTRLASGGGGRGQGEVFVWDAQTGAHLSSLPEPSEVVSALAWNPDGAGLVSGGSDGRLRWWDLRPGECVREREAHQGRVQALKVSPQGHRLASCGEDGAIRVWDLESGEPLRTLRRDRPYERLNITGIRGLTEAQKASLRALGAFEESSVGG